MTNKKIHPSVQQFKEFVRKNPKMISEVRKGNYTWQELFEDWYLLGEEDARWDTFRSEKKDDSAKEKKSDLMSTVLGSLQKMDQNQMQGYISNLSHALAAIQGAISQFQKQSPSNSNSNNNNRNQKNPFMFRED